MKLVRDAATDPEIVAHIEKTVGPGKLSLQCSCLLLGLAAVTALDANIGRASALILADVEKRRAARERAAGQREPQRSAPAAAERPSLSTVDDGVQQPRPAPVLAPIPADAWGEAAR
jgi:hypothetical protein